MAEYTNGQAVEVRHGGQWIPGHYVGANPNRRSEFPHVVIVEDAGFDIFYDACIRPKAPTLAEWLRGVEFHKMAMDFRGATLQHPEHTNTMLQALITRILEHSKQ